MKSMCMFNGFVSSCLSRVRSVSTLIMLIILMIWLFIPAPVTAQDQQVVNYDLIVDTGGSIDVRGGKLKFDGTTVTATAAELNHVADNLPATGGVNIGTNSAPVSSTAATGTVVATGTSVITNGTRVTINDQTYVFVTALPTAANEVYLQFTNAVTGSTNSIAVTNLLLAASVGGTNNPTSYHTNTVAAANVTVSSLAVAELLVTSATDYHGTAGNAFPLSASSATVVSTVPTDALGGGVDGTAGTIGTIVLHGTGLSFTTQASVSNNAVWTTK